MVLHGCPNLPHVSVTSIPPPGNPEGRQLWMTIGLCTGQLLTDVAAKQVGCWHHSLYMEEGGFRKEVGSILTIIPYHTKNQGRKEGRKARNGACSRKRAITTVQSRELSGKIFGWMDGLLIERLMDRWNACDCDIHVTGCTF